MKKTSSVKLSKRINEAAQELCLSNPGLLQKRQKLIDEARSKILEEGFQFVKGKSRSKQNQSSGNNQPTQRRRKYSQSMRDQRMKDIEEDSRFVRSNCFQEKTNISI